MKSIRDVYKIGRAIQLPHHGAGARRQTFS